MVDMGALADSLRRISLQRQALEQIRQFVVVSEHRNNQNNCAVEFYKLCLQRTTLRAFRLFKYMKRHSAE